PPTRSLLPYTTLFRSMGRAIRNLHNLKIRQPLNALHLVTMDRDEKNILIEMEDIVREELNVKVVVYRENEEDLVIYSAKPNFRTDRKSTRLNSSHVKI